MSNLRHAPRERVSWNMMAMQLYSIKVVTLHVSVWVEIDKSYLYFFAVIVTLHVSVWVEISIVLFNCNLPLVTLHVSVWVEINSMVLFLNPFCHAPRERVSWNRDIAFTGANNIVTLHVSVWVEIIPLSVILFFAQVTLHVSVWVEMPVAILQEFTTTSRSTWACELKYYLTFHTV